MSAGRSRRAASSASGAGRSPSRRGSPPWRDDTRRARRCRLVVDDEDALAGAGWPVRHRTDGRLEGVARSSRRSSRSRPGCVRRAARSRRRSACSARRTPGASAARSRDTGRGSPASGRPRFAMSRRMRRMSRMSASASTNTFTSHRSRTRASTKSRMPSITTTSAGGTRTRVVLRAWCTKSYTGFSIASPLGKLARAGRRRRSQSNAFGWSQLTFLRSSNGRCAVVEVVRVHVDERDRRIAERCGDVARDGALSGARSAGDADDQRLHASSSVAARAAAERKVAEHGRQRAGVAVSRSCIGRDEGSGHV